MRVFGIFLLTFLALWLSVGLIGPFGIIAIAALAFAFLLNYCLRLDDRVEALERELHPERFPEEGKENPSFGDRLKENSEQEE